MKLKSYRISCKNKNKVEFEFKPALKVFWKSIDKSSSRQNGFNLIFKKSNSHLDCRLIVVFHRAGHHIGRRLWLGGGMGRRMSSQRRHRRLFPTAGRHRRGGGFFGSDRRKRRPGGAKDGEVAGLGGVQGGGGVEEGVLRWEEGGAAQLRTAHDVVLELLQLLQVGGLQRGVEMRRRARPAGEEICKRKRELWKLR